MSKERFDLLIVGPQEALEEALDHLEIEGSYRLHFCPDFDSACAYLTEGTPSAIVVAPRPCEQSRTEAVNWLEAAKNVAPVLVFYPFEDMEFYKTVMDHGAFDFFTAATPLEQIDRAVNSAVTCQICPVADPRVFKVSKVRAISSISFQKGGGNGMNTLRNSGIGLLAALGVSAFVYFLFSQIPPTFGIPAFARKYQTSCSTCHNDYPELNDFGEAFKKNGFKFPKDDETFVKEAPVMLGAKAQREAFPKAVYPGEIPGSLPLGFRYSGFATYNSKQPSSIGFLPRTDLFVPNTFTIIAAGSFGPTLSFWVDNDISAGGADAAAGLGDGYLKVNDLGHYIGLPKDTLNLRMGQFELDLPFTQARTINLTPYDIYGQASIAASQGTTNNPFVFSIPQRGIEIGGYPNDGNFAWSVSVVNGSNNGLALRNSKDVYVRVSQRFNLERDASVRKEVQAAGPAGPHDHTSLRLGGFYYYGRNALNVDRLLFPTLGTIHEPFYRAGADFRFKYREFELYGLGMYGHDTNLLPGARGFNPGPPVTFSGGFAQANYWFYPWVIGLMRYDVANSPTDFLNGVSRFNSRNRFSPGLQVLVRGNIKVAFEYQRHWEKPVPGTQNFFRPNGFATGIDYSF